MRSKDDNNEKCVLKNHSKASHTELHQTQSLEDLVKFLAREMAQKHFQEQIDYTKAANDEGDG